MHPRYIISFDKLMATELVGWLVGWLVVLRICKRRFSDISAISRLGSRR